MSPYQRIRPFVHQDGALDVFYVADLLISHAVATHGEEIDIIGYYGSYAQGVAGNTRSGYFLYPGGWEKPSCRAHGSRHRCSVRFLGDWVEHDGGLCHRPEPRLDIRPRYRPSRKVLHAWSEEQAARFAELKQKVLDLQKPEARPHMIQRALDEFRNVQAHLGNLHLAVAADDFAVSPV